MYKVNNYPEIKNNYYLLGKNKGESLKLAGKVAIITVFVSKRPTDWCESVREKYYGYINETARFLEKEAKRYGTRLEITNYYTETSVPANADPKKGFELVKKFFGLPDMYSTQKHYENQMKVNEAIIILAFNENGRSFAFEETGIYASNVEEASVIFFSPEIYHYTTYTLAHEILHQFGAVDFYYPAEVLKLAKQYFKKSIMGLGDMTTDDLTAYLVGWKETISAETYWFLRNTMFMTPEKWSESVSAEWTKKW